MKFLKLTFALIITTDNSPRANVQGILLPSGNQEGVPSSKWNRTHHSHCNTCGWRWGLSLNSTSATNLLLPFGLALPYIPMNKYVANPISVSPGSTYTDVWLTFAFPVCSGPRTASAISSLCYPYPYKGQGVMFLAGPLWRFADVSDRVLTLGIPRRIFCPIVTSLYVETVKLALLSARSPTGSPGACQC